MAIEIFDLGLIDFKSAYAFQKSIFEDVKSGKIDSALITCSHPPVLTLGRQIKPQNILASADELRRNGISVEQIERGGDVTYHGPGQLIAYPLFNLALYRKDIHWFLRKLETVIINLLAGFGIEAERRQGLTGVWVGEKKIASIGIAIRSWITFHGLSINIKKDDLANFRLIRPCGMDIEMTSMESVLGDDIEISAVKEVLIKSLGCVPQGAALCV